MVQSYRRQMGCSALHCTAPYGTVRCSAVHLAFCCLGISRSRSIVSFTALFYCPSTSRSHSNVRCAHAKRTCGPLLFVIGTPNVAALYCRGRWQTNSNLSYQNYHRAKPQPDDKRAAVCRVVVSRRCSSFVATNHSLKACCAAPWMAIDHVASTINSIAA